MSALFCTNNYGTFIAKPNRLRRYEILFINIGDYSMKNIILLLIGAFTLTLTSCGALASYSEGSTQKYDDGIYSSAPSFKNNNETTADKIGRAHV